MHVLRVVFVTALAVLYAWTIRQAHFFEQLNASFRGMQNTSDPRMLAMSLGAVHWIILSSIALALALAIGPARDAQSGTAGKWTFRVARFFVLAAVLLIPAILLIKSAFTVL